MFFICWHRLLLIMFNLKKRLLALEPEPETFPYLDSGQSVISPMRLPGDRFIWGGETYSQSQWKAWIPPPSTTLDLVPTTSQGCCPQIFSQVSYFYSQLISVALLKLFWGLAWVSPISPRPCHLPQHLEAYSTQWQDSTSCTPLLPLHLFPGWNSASFFSLQPAVWLPALTLPFTNLFSLLPKVSF